MDINKFCDPKGHSSWFHAPMKEIIYGGLIGIALIPLAFGWVFFINFMICG